MSRSWSFRPQDQEATHNPPQQVVVVGFNMPFWDLVLFLVKFSIASIPAGIILLILAVAVVFLLATLGITLFPDAFRY
jgi:hypothetical protein